MKLETPLKSVYGIGPGLLFRLKNLGLETVADLVNHYPFRYDDFSNVTQALDAQIGERVTLKGEIWSITNFRTKTGKLMIKALFNDGTTTIDLTWFNQAWLLKQLKVGDRIQISGKLDQFKNKLSIISPVWEKDTSPLAISLSDHALGAHSQESQNSSADHLHTGRLVPVYPETAGLSSKWLRAKIDKVLEQVSDQIVDPIPESIRADFIPLVQALKKIHFPENGEDVKQARERLAFDELFYLQLQNQMIRNQWIKQEVVEPLKIADSDLVEILESLPFTLTDSQLKVVHEVMLDLKGSKPMNRLVQGEVGSGKTVVALILAYLVHKNRLRTLYMAPTEILAIQHYNNFKKMLEPLGLTIGIYTGSQKFTKQKGEGKRGKKKDSVILSGSEESQDRKTNHQISPHFANPLRQDSADQEATRGGHTVREDMKVTNFGTEDTATPFIPDIIIGTHALLSDKLITQEVGMIIIDEQQRFGVAQRSLLRSRAKLPHFLTMTATPIPRTVALTMYGDLDVSVIDQMPTGRKKINTHVVPDSKRVDSYGFIREHIQAGEQAYIITPLIELSETIQSAKAAVEEFQTLQKEIFPELRLGLLHGRLSSKEKDAVLTSFRDHEIDILVSTTVVEVGVDVPNATIMVIESAERFGLAQLHQLRGRVGRGEKQSFCLLFAGDEKPEAVSRLRNLESIDNGLKLAELDLKIRGSGEIHGTAQSGRFELKIASFTDIELIEKARNSAKRLIDEDSELTRYPLLKERIGQNTSYIMPD